MAPPPGTPRSSAPRCAPNPTASRPVRARPTPARSRSLLPHSLGALGAVGQRRDGPRGRGGGVVAVETVANGQVAVGVVRRDRSDDGAQTPEGDVVQVV